MLNNSSIPRDVPAASPATAGKKKSGWCGIWGCIGIFVTLCACLILVAGGGYYLYTTNTELQKIFVGPGIVPTAVPELDAGGKPIGPKVLDTTDSALNSRFSNSFRHYSEMSMDGYDQNNGPLKRTIILDQMQQEQPEWSSYKHQMERINDSTIDESEGAVLKGKSYDSQDDGTCRVSNDSFAGTRELENWPRNLPIIGRLKRVETGVTVNDVLTDRYEVTLENLGSGRSTVTEWKSGSLYRARVGGYVVRLEYTIVVEPQAWGMNGGSEYSTNRPAILTFLDDFFYFPNGTMSVKVPAACAGEVPIN